MAEYAWLEHYPTHTEWAAMIDAKPLYTILDKAAAEFPQSVAVDFLGKKTTYQQIESEVSRLTEGLCALGVTKGMRVGLLLPNSPYYVISYFAILKAGATVVNFSPLAAPREVKAQIEDSGTEVMITLNMELCQGKLDGLLESTPLEKVIVARMQDALPFPKNLLFPVVKKKEIAPMPADARYIAWKDVLAGHDEECEPAQIDPKRDIAVLQYTGGTTGTPKGAILTHENLYSNAQQCKLWCGNLEKGSERILAVLPFFHVFAMTAVMNTAIVIGARMILHPKVELPKVIKDIHKKKPTMMPGVPTLFSAIAHYPALSGYDLHSLKVCMSGGAPLPIDVKKRFEGMTGCELLEGYGLTEASPVAAANPLAGKTKEGSIGLPLPQTVIRVEDMERRGVFLPVGKVGEICISGPQVMRGYWQNEEETKQVLEDGLLRTGDVGYMDEEGYFFIVDRRKELILTGGFNVYPRQVEEAIYRHEAVLEAAVVGVEDAHYGQIVKAYVVVEDGQTLEKEALLEFLRTELAKYEVPREIEFRESLPKTMIGKISKKDL